MKKLVFVLLFAFVSCGFAQEVSEAQKLEITIEKLESSMTKVLGAYVVENDLRLLELQTDFLKELEKLSEEKWISERISRNLAIFTIYRAGKESSIDKKLMIYNVAKNHVNNMKIGYESLILLGYFILIPQEELIQNNNDKKELRLEILKEVSLLFETLGYGKDPMFIVPEKFKPTVLQRRAYCMARYANLKYRVKGNKNHYLHNIEKAIKYYEEALKFKGLQGDDKRDTFYNSVFSYLALVKVSRDEDVIKKSLLKALLHSLEAWNITQLDAYGNFCLKIKQLILDKDNLFKSSFRNNLRKYDHKKLKGLKWYIKFIKKAVKKIK